MKMKFLNYIFLAGVTSLLFTSCIKDDVTDTTDHGDTFVKLLEAPVNQFFFEPFTETITLRLFSLRKEANSNASLNTPLQVKLKIEPTLLANYNAANGSSFELMPDSIYTLDPGNPKVGTLYEMSMSAGQFAKEFTIKLNGAKWDVTKKYAFPFVITDASGKPVSDGKKEIVATVSIKNQYDALYHATGVFHHPTGGDRPIDEDKALVTAGPTSVICNLGDLGANGYRMILTVNADNSVTISPAGATPNIDQSWGDNYYDPADQSFHLHYSYNTAAPRIVEEIIKRK